MAGAKPKAKEVVKEQATEAPAKVESVYSTEELVKNYSAFNASREIVAVALKQAKKESATYEEAKAIIEKFKTRRIS